MTTETITFVAVGIGLAGVIWYDRQLWRKAREKWEQEMRLDSIEARLKRLECDKRSWRG